MNKQEISEILKEVTYKEGFRFIVGDNYLQLEENSVCNRSGEPYLSKGRKWIWSPFMVKSEIVSTCLKAVLQYEEHEARENFKYKGVSIFDPHYNVDELVKLRKSDGWAEVREHHDMKEIVFKNGLDHLPWEERKRFCYCKKGDTHCGDCSCGKRGHLRGLMMGTFVYCDECYETALEDLV